MVSQFLYVGVQSAIFGFFINYIVAEMPIAGLLAPSDNDAGLLLQGAFLLFLLGRFTGSIALRYFTPNKVLGWYALIGTVLSLLVMQQFGWVSVIALFGTFFLMSIMFPTIFSLGIHGVGEHTKRASSFIVMAIVGGAVTPPLMGKLADIVQHAHQLPGAAALLRRHRRLRPGLAEAARQERRAA